MSDIFLSYASEDRESARGLAGALERHGWTVWWDRRIPAGRNYAEVIEAQLAEARCVVVLWSKASVASHWVNTEAAEANDRRVLVPVLIEPVKIPLEFRRIQAANLTDWRAGAEEHSGLKMLITDLEVLLGLPPGRPAPPAPAAPLVSFEEPSPSKNLEGARRGIKYGVDARTEGGGQFEGIFISYRRGEAETYASNLHDRLAARFGGEKVFLDIESVAAGRDFGEAIAEAAGSCALMFVLISPHWSRGMVRQAGADNYVRLEVATALRRGIPVMPILIQGANMPAPMELPEDLAPLVRRNALVLSDTRWDRDVKDLIKYLEGFLKA